ncbi:MAG: LysR family regulatory protein CidR, partial [uncultured Rubrobacteraceae bacterium]
GDGVAQELRGGGRGVALRPGRGEAAHSSACPEPSRAASGGRARVEPVRSGPQERGAHGGGQDLPGRGPRYSRAGRRCAPQGRARPPGGGRGDLLRLRSRDALQRLPGHREAVPREVSERGALPARDGYGGSDLRPRGGPDRRRPDTPRIYPGGPRRRDRLQRTRRRRPPRHPSARRGGAGRGFGPRGGPLHPLPETLRTEEARQHGRPLRRRRLCPEYRSGGGVQAGHGRAGGRRDRGLAAPRLGQQPPAQRGRLRRDRRRRPLDGDGPLLEPGAHDARPQGLPRHRARCLPRPRRGRFRASRRRDPGRGRSTCRPV